MRGIRVFGVALVFAASAAPAQAQEAEPTRTIDLGGGMKIDLPKDWSLDYFKNPAAEMPSLKSMGIKAHDWRYDSGTMRIGLTYMMFPGSGKGSKPDPDGTERRAKMAEVFAQYLPSARESEAETLLIDNGSLTGAYGSLHARDGAAFPVFFGRTYQCVTSAVAHLGDSLLVVSVGSADCDSAEHKAAVAALATLHE